MNAKTKIVILGCQGQLGTSLRNLLGEQALGLSRADLDLSKIHEIKDVVSGLSAQIVINCAAYNLVDKAEEDTQSAWELNWQVPFELAKVCQQTGKKLVHISTDYVFSQEHHRAVPYQETDLPSPATVYGLTKLAGELAVSGYCTRHLVIRTCGLFGHAERGGKMNFVDMMLKKAQAGEQLKVVHDQVCSPTSTADLAWGIVELINQEATGLFHVVNQGAVTWFDFAQMILKQRGLSAEISPVTSASFGAKAKRPLYSVLSTQKFQQATDREMPTLEESLQNYLRKYH